MESQPPCVISDLGADLVGGESGGLFTALCVAPPGNQACLAQQ